MGYLSPPPSPQPVVVYKDVGGLVSDYEARTEDYRRENREVRLHECRSACTLALSLPNVCVYPDAKLKFHQAYNELTREADLGVSARLFDSYPAAVRDRLGYLTRQYKVLSGVELIALGVRDCARGDRVMVAAKKPPRRRPRRPPPRIPLQIPCAKSPGTCRWRWRTPWPGPRTPRLDRRPSRSRTATRSLRRSRGLPATPRRARGGSPNPSRCRRGVRT